MNLCCPTGRAVFAEQKVGNHTMHSGWKRLEMTKKWGDWEVNLDIVCLEFIPDDGRWYEIDLQQLNSAAPILDWIYQFAEKTWAREEDVGHLVRALRYIFGRDVAGGGISRDIDTRAILEAKYGLDLS